MLRLLRCAGFRDEDIARVVGATSESVSNWASGRGPDNQAERRLTKLHAIVAKLEEAGMFPRGQIGPWFRTPTQWLDWKTPIDLLEGGEVARVEDFITGRLFGYPT